MEPASSKPLSETEENNGNTMAPSGKQAANFSKERRLDDGGIQHDNTDDHQEDDVQAVAPLSVSPVITGAAVGSYSTSFTMKISDTYQSIMLGTSAVPQNFDPDNDLLGVRGHETNPAADGTLSGNGSSSSSTSAHTAAAAAADASRLGLLLDSLGRDGHYVHQKLSDCENDKKRRKLAWRVFAPDYSSARVGGWFCWFQKLEQVFLIVPHLKKAKPDAGHVTVYRFGEMKTVKYTRKDYDRNGRDVLFDTIPKKDRGYVEYIGTDLVGVVAVEKLGDGRLPHRFEGNGIKLYEAAAWQFGKDLKPKTMHKFFLQHLFKEFCECRRRAVGFPACPSPETAKTAGGIVEFRILTYERDGEKE